MISSVLMITTEWKGKIGNNWEKFEWKNAHRLPA